MNEDQILAYAILNEVATKLNIPVCEIRYAGLFNRRKRHFTTYIKSICVIKILIQTQLSLKQIATVINRNRDHSMMIYYRDIYNDTIDTNRDLRKLVRMAA